MNIKISYVLNLLLAAALVLLLAHGVIHHDKTAESPTEQSSSEPDGKTGATKTILKSIMSRTSVRDYTDQEISDWEIEKMLKAAMAAPTAGNKQPWRFVVIKERTTLDAIAANCPNIGMAAKAPLAIVVCGDTTATFPGDGVGFWIQDTSAATENLLLAAHALSLGAVWCGIAPIQEKMDYISELLSLPSNVLPLNVVVIGHPAETPQPKDKWQPDYIHYEKY